MFRIFLAVILTVAGSEPMADDTDLLDEYESYSKRVLELRREFQIPPFPRKDLSRSGFEFFAVLDHILASAGSSVASNTVQMLRESKESLEEAAQNDEVLRAQYMKPFCNAVDEGDIAAMVDEWFNGADGFQSAYAQRYKNIFDQIPQDDMKWLEKNVLEPNAWLLVMPEPTDRRVVEALAKEFPKITIGKFKSRCAAWRRVLQERSNA